MSEKKGANNKQRGEEEITELRRGPWTLEEDELLMRYIAYHGEGRWNLLARCSGLKRTGKSCRLRWLNYLKPDIKRGNLTPEEQFLILELHSKWGNRWSRIAQHLPGRTDNEIKNYWRTRVQKQARQLKIDANSTMFRDALRCYWMPRLLEKIGSQTSRSLHDPFSTTPTAAAAAAAAAANASSLSQDRHHVHHPPFLDPIVPHPLECSRSYDISGSENYSPSTSSGSTALPQVPQFPEFPSSPTDELNGVAFDALLGGHSSHGYYHQELDGLDLASLSSSSLLGYASTNCGVSVASSNSCLDSVGDSSFWSCADELWHGRKLNEWGGI
ncbi:Transcription factor MYB108 [Ananas comosus]|uniref:Transcription factor MYB108 n=2 Tax=Ananas comosus TaxID=4615 RepID=A0A199VTY9_ANACO|nr:Transcription factor MYB108 [Ananas comosus]CAD1842341.1 unnamed protein product [Ananas comosus var. bracteatus]